MNERLQCDFSLVRYVPDPVKNEFVNIGVMLREAARPDAPVVRFTKDWARVRCVDPDADIDMLEAMETEMRRRLLESASDATPLMKTIEDSFSHQLQMTEPKAFLAENASAGMEELMQLYVEPRRQRARQALSGRQAIARNMRTQFEHARVWDLMRKRIAASAYTKPGDSLQNRLRLSAQRSGADVSRRVSLRRCGAGESTGLQLAVAAGWRGSSGECGAGTDGNCEPLRNSNGEVSVDEDHVEQYRFGVETMEAQQIRVLTVSDLERVAETAKRELRV